MMVSFVLRWLALLVPSLLAQRKRVGIRHCQRRELDVVLLSLLFYASIALISTVIGALPMKLTIVFFTSQMMWLEL